MIQATELLKQAFEKANQNKVIIISPLMADKLIREGTLQIKQGQRHYYVDGAKVYVSGDACDEEILIR